MPCKGAIVCKQPSDCGWKHGQSGCAQELSVCVSRLEGRG